MLVVSLPCLIKQFTYNKNEKLKSRKALDNLFKNGKSFFIFPVKIFYCIEPASATNNIKCGVGVSKKYFAKATDRNRIKRLLRECYRLNKAQLHHATQHKQISFFMLYVDKQLPPNVLALQQPVNAVLTKLIKIISNEMGE